MINFKETGVPASGVAPSRMSTPFTKDSVMRLLKVLIKSLIVNSFKFFRFGLGRMISQISDPFMRSQTLRMRVSNL